ncbi:hypothetical protein ACFU99_33670, partial [Streptomyces sp. NPDC057654]
MTQQTGSGAIPAETDGESARPETAAAGAPRTAPDSAPGPDGAPGPDAAPGADSARVDLAKARPRQQRKAAQEPPPEAAEDVKDVENDKGAESVDDGFGSAFCSSMATL